MSHCAGCGSFCSRSSSRSGRFVNVASNGAPWRKNERLLFSEQTNRSFFLHGAPCDATLTNLPDRLELREQKLPNAAQWAIAVGRAGSIFGVAASPLLKSSNVMALATDVKQKVTGARRACQTYCQRLQDQL